MSTAPSRRGLLGALAALPLAAIVPSSKAVQVVTQTRPEGIVTAIGRRIGQCSKDAIIADAARNRDASDAAWRIAEDLQAQALLFPARTLSDALVQATVAQGDVGDLAWNEHTEEERNELYDRIHTALASIVHVLSRESGMPVEAISEDWHADQFAKRFPAWSAA